MEDNIPQSVDVGCGMLHWYSLNTSLIRVQSSYNDFSKLVPHVKQLNGPRPLHLLPAVLLLLSAVQTTIINSYKKCNTLGGWKRLRTKFTVRNKVLDKVHNLELMPISTLYPLRGKAFCSNAFTECAALWNWLYEGAPCVSSSKCDLRKQ